MSRILEDRLVVATHNEGKLREIRDLLGPFGLDITSAGQLGLPVPEETGRSFLENARIKAVAAAEASCLVALSDDSGLCVDALGGEPGVDTAEWGGPDRDWGLAMRRVEDRLARIGASSPDRRRAYFVCTLCLAWPDGTIESFEGRVSGTLVWPPRGDVGHGYDPMFQPDGYDKTFGEMTAAEKHGRREGRPGLSHRARAFDLLSCACLRAHAGL